MIIKAGLLIDFGNSETRVFLVSGSRAYRFNMSNKFVSLPAGYRVNSRYVNHKTSIFQYKGAHFANGAIVEREFVGKEIRPSALEPKPEQLVTDLTLSLAFIKSLHTLSSVHNMPVESLDVTFNVSVLLPPLDHEKHEAKMIEVIKKHGEATKKSNEENKNHGGVSLVMPYSMEANFKIGDINVYSEAVSAFFGAFYREEGLEDLSHHNEGKSLARGDVLVRDNGKDVELVEVPENTKFASGYTLVLDIGAGTTDIALFLDMELIEDSKDTFNRGGNTVQSVIRNEIKKEYGFVPNDVYRVVSEGILEEGNTEHDVADIVTRAKEAYSKTMQEEITSYLERMSISMPLVKGLLVAGGGSLATKRYVDTSGNYVKLLDKAKPEDTPKVEIKGQVYEESEVEYTEVEVSPAMSEVLMTYLQKLAPNMEILNTGGKDLRALNIEGLLYLHKYSEE